MGRRDVGRRDGVGRRDSVGRGMVWGGGLLKEEVGGERKDVGEEGW